MKVERSSCSGMTKMHRVIVSELDAGEYESDRQTHAADRLNARQREIYDYVLAHPNDIIVIQAGPGTGKTFTLKTIAYNCRRPSTVVIYKHDLLRKFKYCSIRYTVAKLFMQLFNIAYFPYKALCRQITASMSCQEFIYCLLSLLQAAYPMPFVGGFVLLDEYTVMPKPLLVILLMLLKHYRIGTIISGDSNQLQSIQTGPNNGKTSFEIAKIFSNREFSLDTNERCTDARYNRLVEYMSTISSSNRMDESGYAIISAMFLDKLATSSPYTDIHLAGTHRELARLIHMYVVNEGIPVEFYQITPRRPTMRLEFDVNEARESDDCNAPKELPNGMIQPTIVTKYLLDRQPDKFLPYLPLKIGASYYVNAHSEDTIAELIAYDAAKETVTMRDRAGVTETYEKANNTDDVVFGAHLEELLKGASGTVCNYPIYPANIMSMHKCQGCTISGPLDINLSSTTYQGAYVAISRVTHPDCIRRIIVPDMLSYMLSTIVNFPEYVDSGQMDFDANLIDSKMLNYKFYKIKNPRTVADLLLSFVTADTVESRASIRDRLIEYSKSCRETLIQRPRTPNCQDLAAINTFVEEFEVFMRAAHIAIPTDRAVWLHEYMLRSPSYLAMLQEPVNVGFASLVKYCNPKMVYSFEESTREYIESHAVLAAELTDSTEPLKLRKEGDLYWMLAQSEFQKTVHDMLAHEPDSLSPEWLRSILPRLYPGSGLAAKRARSSSPTTRVKPSERSNSDSSSSSQVFELIKNKKHKHA